MPTTFATRNPLAQPARQEMIELLNRRMADILDLHYQTLLAHWNVRGENFIGLHRLFDEFAGCNGADNWCDWVAERIGQLGGAVETTVHYISEKSGLKPYPTDISSGSDHVAHLCDALAVVLVAFRDAASRADELEDVVSAEILRRVQVSGEKYLWLLEAHLGAGQRAK